jgi:hypothetical protein
MTATEQAELVQAVIAGEPLCEHRMKSECGRVAVWRTRHAPFVYEDLALCTAHALKFSEHTVSEFTHLSTGLAMIPEDFESEISFRNRITKAAETW